MNVATAIRRAITILAEHGRADSGILRASLLGAGLSSEQAHDAVRFVPLAFGRQILAGMGVELPDSYIRIRAVDGRREEKPLAEEPFYREALKAAPILGSELGGDVFTNVALLSSELQAVNEALNAGANPEGLVASPPLIEWNRPPSLPPPWWKFWA
jgi:hypothetical protein